MHLYLARQKRWLLYWLLPFLIVGCTEVRLIGAYDQTIDEGIQKVSKDIATLLIQVEKNHLDGRSAENGYDHFRDTYTGIEAEMQSLKIRSNALPKYKIISSQLDLLNQNIRNLEALHKTGFSASGGNPLTVLQTVNAQFETAFTAMLALQNGLKREKADKNK